MSEQARIETAVEATIDNCELFRVQIAEQAREIASLKDGQAALILVRDDYKRQADEYRAKCARASAVNMSNGLPLPERDAVIRKAVGLCNRIPGSTTWNAAEFAYDEFAARLSANAVVMPEPDFFWVEADEGSWNSPEEWAQDYYDYSGEKPESVSFSCAIDLPNREYDSFEFDADGNCISCRLVNTEVAHLNQSRGVPEATLLLRRIVSGEVGRQMLDKLATGQATETEDGKAWLEASARLSAAPSQPDQCAGVVQVPRELLIESIAVLMLYTRGSASREGILINDLRALLAGGIQMTRASNHPCERDRSGLHIARAALLRRQAQYSDAYLLIEALIDQIRLGEPEAGYDQLAADNKRLREAITLALNEVDGNIRPAVRDLVNRLAGVQNGANPNDIYDYCDAIDDALSTTANGEQLASASEGDV